MLLNFLSENELSCCETIVVFELVCMDMLGKAAKQIGMVQCMYSDSGKGNCIM